MSGLVGVISHDQTVPVPEEEILGLARAYRQIRGETEQESAAAGGHARVVRFSRAADCPSAVPPREVPSAGRSESWVLSVGVVHEGGPQRDGSQHWLAGLDGQFALIAHDAPSGDVVVASDPFGMLPVYVATRCGRTYVSTSSLALAKHLGCNGDPLGMHGFLLAGYHFGTRTNWQGIERLDPGSEVRFSSRGCRRGFYWRPTVDEQVARMTFGQSVEHCLETAIETCRRYLSPDPTWSDLTGGFDSRLLNLVLDRAGVDFRTNTRTTTDPDEVRISRLVAAEAAWEWTNPALPGNWEHVLPGLLPSALAWGDADLEVLQLSRVLWVHEQLGRTLPALISAGGGEHLQYAAWKSEFAEAGRTNKVNLDNWLTMRLLKPVNTGLFPAQVVPRVRDDFRNRMGAWAEPYREHRNTVQLDMLYAYKSTGHFGAYRAADDGFLDAKLPFYTKPLFTAAVSTNYRYRNGHRLMRHMVERLDPRIAALPTTRGGPAQPWRPSNAHRFVPYYSSLGRKAVTKVSTKYLGRPLLLRTTSFPWAGRANAIVLEHLQREALFDPADLRSASLIARPALEPWLRRAAEPEFADSALLGRLITVELALRAADVDVGVD